MTETELSNLSRQLRKDIAGIERKLKKTPRDKRLRREWEAKQALQARIFELRIALLAPPPKRPDPHLGRKSEPEIDPVRRMRLAPRPRPSVWLPPAPVPPPKVEPAKRRAAVLLKLDAPTAPFPVGMAKAASQDRANRARLLAVPVDPDLILKPRPRIVAVRGPAPTTVRRKVTPRWQMIASPAHVLTPVRQEPNIRPDPIGRFPVYPCRRCGRNIEASGLVLLMTDEKPKMHETCQLEADAERAERQNKSRGAR